MPPNSCNHWDSYKTTGARLYNYLHGTFVATGTTKAIKLKKKVARCYICKKFEAYLHICFHCGIFGCCKHIREHSKKSKHTFAMELSHGKIYCSNCGDMICNKDINEIAVNNMFRTRQRIIDESILWMPSRQEVEMIKRSKSVKITSHSKVGLRGLRNLGSTCFMNSVVQALVHTPILREHFFTEKHQCKDMPANCLISNLFQDFYKEQTTPLVLHSLLHLIWNQARHLAGYEQQDAHEFFIAALDVLHRHCSEAMPTQGTATIDKISRCSCIIDQIFRGSLQSDIVCQKCRGVSTTIDPIRDFSLDLGPVTAGGRPPSSLIHCLERFTRAEHLGSNAKIMCSNCQSHQESTKQLTMKTLPVVVSFHLKRFQHSEKMEKKISTIISFPEILDMTPFMSPKKSATMASAMQDNEYSLFAVINHLGNSINVGHYICYVRQLHNYWYKCDDHFITRANIYDVLGSEGYLLFYHKNVLKYE